MKLRNVSSDLKTCVKVMFMFMFIYMYMQYCTAILHRSNFTGKVKPICSISPSSGKVDCFLWNMTKFC